ncbi:MAG: YihY/virulence factor BrkB family protein [Parasphingorhabdus sp.]|nr:YihY/virulence factor BrkB family protein [Parasphingorhabdus sp.]
MADISPLSPEVRRREDNDGGDTSLLGKARIIIVRVAVGTYNDGFTFAGNFAYLALLAVFSFFIVTAAIAGSFGDTAIGIEFVAAFLGTVPPSVADVLREPIRDAMAARTGPLLWFSAAVGLWTTASLVETIRGILHRSYGVSATRPFWEYRLTSIAMIVASVVLAMLALSTQVAVASLEQFFGRYTLLPQFSALWVSLTRIIPFLVLFTTLYILFRILTPRQYRGSGYPKWPGAVFISGWWLVTTALLPLFLFYAADYKLTYGSLAGVMITLIFFYLVGLGMVIGAELNAALAEAPRRIYKEQDAT